MYLNPGEAGEDIAKLKQELAKREKELAGANARARRGEGKDEVETELKQLITELKQRSDKLQLQLLTAEERVEQDELEILELEGALFAARSPPPRITITLDS